MYTIVITRPAVQSQVLCKRLKALKMRVILAPSIETKLTPRSAQERQVISALKAKGFDWLVFTSANGVNFFAQVLKRNRVPISVLRGISVAVQGPKTSQRLKELLHVRSRVAPREALAEELVAVFGKLKMQGKRVLLAVAQETRDVLEPALRRQGALVTKLPVYHTSPVPLSTSVRRQILKCSPSELIITFFSPSAVRSFVRSLKAPPGFLSKALIASIGPVTSRGLEEQGVAVEIEARDHTEEGLLREIEGLGVV